MSVMKLLPRQHPPWAAKAGDACGFSAAAVCWGNVSISPPCLGVALSSGVGVAPAMTQVLGTSPSHGCVLPVCPYQTTTAEGGLRAGHGRVACNQRNEPDHDYEW